MQEYDFLLMYEHKVRELDNLCLLKYELDKRGYRTKILYANNFDLIEARTVMYRTKVLVIGYCYTSSSIRDYASYRIKFDKVINLQWEQVTTNEQEKDSGSFRNLSGLAKEIVHISWGEKNQKRLIEKAGVAPRNVKVTGNITMDLLRPEFRGFYFPREEICRRYDLPEEKKLCLFIAGFKYVEVSAEAKRATIARFGEGRRHYLEVAEKEQLTILQWFRQFLEENKDCVIVYRPHPGDPSPRAEKLAQEYENFRVISELSVKQWIAVSDLVYAWNSTAILEAFFAGKNPIYLCPYPIPEDQDHPLLMEMNKVEDYETFRKTVSGEVLDIGLTKEMVNPFYLVDEKRASYLKIADAFEEVYRDDIYTLDSRQRRAYRGLYSFKDRMVIIFMRMTFLYRIYRWALVHIPLPFIKKRRMWLESYQDKEFRKWKEMNVIEADTDGEVDAVIHRIQGLVEG
ncbi:hypothetical protein D7V90_07180 [bacterium 1xD42-87]|jgi:surface carbohydrate biosynthesis protein|nr:hypothetical protein D7V90_07180 [bacterium 1xD42-87]